MKRYAGYFAVVTAILLLAVSAGQGEAAVSVSPSQAAVTPGQTNTIRLQYRFSGLLDAGAVPGPYNGIADSPGGTLLGGVFAEVVFLGTISTPVIANISNGAGTASETLTLPASLIDSAIAQGIRQITYVRSFAGPSNEPTSVVNLLVAGSEAVGPLRIQRIELYFKNRRGEITVARNERGLKAFADIRYAGTGVLTGFWEVDGRRILDVNKQLLFGTNVTLATPDIPDLPTFDTGAHIVRFVVTSPAQSVATPQLLYYVTAVKELQPLRISARMEDGEGGVPAKRVFAWEKPAGIDVFFVEFAEEPGGKPVFSAFTREGSYTIPDEVVGGTFTPGKRYYWRVKGYDTNGEQVAESEPAPFVY